MIFDKYTNFVVFSFLKQLFKKNSTSRIVDNFAINKMSYCLFRLNKKKILNVIKRLIKK